MRSFVPLGVLALAACSGSAPSGPASDTFAGAGRDRLCIAGEGDPRRAGLIVYGARGDTNCSAAGRLERSGDRWTLTPKGEGACTLTLTLAGDTLTIAHVPARCGYYCGPGATLTGKSFTRDAAVTAAVDLAGDPLC